MFDGLILFGNSIVRFGTPEIIAYALLSSLVGVVMGALPGLTATMALALMTTLTLKLPSSQALLILICTYVGSIYGGSRSAILLNIPGTPASAASCLDGYALARQGMAGRAMGIATTGSVMGTLIGMFFLAGFTPILGGTGAEVRRLRILLAGAVRRHHRRHAHRRRPAQGLDRRHRRPVDRHHRTGAAIRLRAFCLGRARPGRRHPAGAGAGGRLRLRRAADGDAASARRRSRSAPSTP